MGSERTQRLLRGATLAATLVAMGCPAASPGVDAKPIGTSGTSNSGTSNSSNSARTTNSGTSNSPTSNGSTSSGPTSKGAAPSTKEPVARPPETKGADCSSDADCQLAPCEACSCRVFRKGAVSGCNPVPCFVDPCRDSAAVCKRDGDAAVGRCVLVRAKPPAL